MKAKEKRHWADTVADQAVQRGPKHVVSSGVTPSGPFHIGHLREILTADAIYRTLSERNVECSFNYVADSLDPLRRVYPFLDSATYSAHIGKPLSYVPCPCGDHPSYAEHFLIPFIETLGRLGVQVETVRAHEAYARGNFDEVAITALEQRDTIRAILQEETGKQPPEGWSPFNTLCPECGRITTTTVTGFDARRRTVTYKCACGSEGTVPIAGGGKLTWRVDWPARWKVFGVTVEQFGKDHASKGGSYDTGSRIAREVFGIEPPLPVPYEWIGLRGQGDMSSSKGNVVTIAQVLDVVPPEVIRFFIFKNSLAKSLTFDPGLPLLNLFDEYQTAARAGNSRAVELSRTDAGWTLGIPYRHNRHIVSLVQTTNGDVDTIAEILRRNGIEVEDSEALNRLVTYASRWLETFAPEEVKFEVQQKLPERVVDLTGEQKRFLEVLADRLQPDMNAEQIHNLIYAIKDELAMSPGAVFEAIYVSLLGKDRGPRAGWFLSSLGLDFVTRRFKEAAVA